MNTWFTSDLHFGHLNIISYANRPYKSVEQMNMALIRNWNSRVKPGDIVFHIGDFCFRNTEGGKEGEGLKSKAMDYASQLNGHITFIKGNHDKNNSLNAVIKYAIIELGGKEIFLIHNPMEYNNKFDLNLVGHVHEAWKIKKIGRTYLYNVGVDVNKFAPININEIMANISNHINIYGKEHNDKLEETTK